MEIKELPTILIIDDLDSHSSIKLALESAGLARVKNRLPQDVDLNDLLSTNLALVDYQLDTWPERDKLDAISLQPRDGLALASVLRRHLHDREQSSPTAFALYTGNIDKVAAPLPPEYREHALASLNNLEWVFQKAKPGSEAPIAEQIAQLASAVQALPKEWPSSEHGESMRELAKLLAVDSNDPLGERLLEDVEACLPPIHELSRVSHGLTILRWLLHRILPFPCFLSDTYRLAARFRIEHRALYAALETGKPLDHELDDCRYKGILSSFLGPRWWRSKIELLLWEKSNGNSSDIEIVRGLIQELSGDELPASNPADHPMVCINTHYQALDDFFPIEDCVRIHPDDWPTYADQAWTTKELAKSEPKLRALVIGNDRELLDQ